MIFDRKIEKREMTINEWKEMYSFEKGYDNSPFDNDMRESTYFSCIKIISEGIAKATCQVKQEIDKGEVIDKNHYLTDLLRLRTNPYSNAVDVFKTFVALSKHYGISGLFIDRNSSKIKGLYPVKITNITIDDAGLIKSVKDNKILYDWQGANGETGSCFDKDMIVLRDFSTDGINTKAVKAILKENMDTSIKSQKYLNTLFSNGLCSRIVVQLTSDMKEEKELKKTQDKFDRIYSNNGRILTVPAGYNVSSLNLSLADSQFAELRFISKKDMASAMGVPLSKLGEINENAKSEEQNNLSFLTDTLQIIFTSIEQEMDWKLLSSADRSKGFKIRFNTNVILRMDSKTQAEVINSYVKNGVYSLNTAKEILGIEKLDKDVTTFPSGQVTLEQMLNNSVSYAKESSTKVGDDNDNTITN